jgi:Uma2 family endonuclease
MNSSIRENSSAFQTMDAAPRVPMLASGDVLNAAEYWRRYIAAPEKTKAERINGKVYLMNPLRAVQHGNPHVLLSHWLSAYAMRHSNLTVSDNATIRLNSENDPQPDLCMYLTGGQTRLDDGFIVGPPEMIVEIAGSSASYDFGEKRDVYESAGVGEYLVFETIEGRIVWWRNVDGRFEEITPDGGVYRSFLFPGLWLDMHALRTANAARLIDTLQAGMGSV